MDDDDYVDRGPSGAAWFALGRMSAENARSRSAALAGLFGDAPVPARTYNEQVAIGNDWRAECLRLQQVNANLVAQLNASRKHAAELKAWGEDWRVRWYELFAESGRKRRQRDEAIRDEIERLKGTTNPS